MCYQTRDHESPHAEARDKQFYVHFPGRRTKEISHFSDGVKSRVIFGRLLAAGDSNFSIPTAATAAASDILVDKELDDDGKG